MIYLVRRIAGAALVLWFVMTCVFLLVHVVGDPARAALGERASPAQLEAFRARHALDQPLGARYAAYLGELVTLRLGRSYQDEEEVRALIGRRLPRTMLLGAMAIGMELGLGILLGTLAALKRGRWIDSVVMSGTFVGLSLPSFLLGMWVLSTFAFRLGWFPIGGYGDAGWDHVWHAILPALTLAVLGTSTYARLVRSELIEALESDYVRTARAKGISRARVVLVHAGRNALLPVVTLLGLSLRLLVSGAVVVETVFGWPGMGRLAVESISGLDLPVVMGIVFVGCAVVQIGNVAADFAVYALDPRQRTHE
ncbi:MAG: ABC transporter permease [Polyangiales bacterium]